MPQTVDTIFLRHGHHQGRFPSDGETFTGCFGGVERELRERDRVKMQREKRYATNYYYVPFTTFIVKIER